MFISVFHFFHCYCYFLLNYCILIFFRVVYSIIRIYICGLLQACLIYHYPYGVHFFFKELFKFIVKVLGCFIIRRGITGCCCYYYLADCPLVFFFTKYSFLFFLLSY